MFLIAGIHSRRGWTPWTGGWNARENAWTGSRKQGLSRSGNTVWWVRDFVTAGCAPGQLLGKQTLICLASTDLCKLGEIILLLVPAALWSNAIVSHFWRSTIFIRLSSSLRYFHDFIVLRLLKITCRMNEAWKQGCSSEMGRHQRLELEEMCMCKGTQPCHGRV